MRCVASNCVLRAAATSGQRASAASTHAIDFEVLCSLAASIVYGHLNPVLSASAHSHCITFFVQAWGPLEARSDCKLSDFPCFPYILAAVARRSFPRRHGIGALTWYQGAARRCGLPAAGSWHCRCSYLASRRDSSTDTDFPFDGYFNAWHTDFGRPPALPRIRCSESSVCLV